MKKSKTFKVTISEETLRQFYRVGLLSYQLNNTFDENLWDLLRSDWIGPPDFPKRKTPYAKDVVFFKKKVAKLFEKHDSL